MKNKLELTVQILFLILSVSGAVFTFGRMSSEASADLFLTNIINAVFTGVYLIIRFLIKDRRRSGDLQRAMLLFIIYSCLPVFVLVNNPVTRILSVLCFADAVFLFIYMNVDGHRSAGELEFSRRRRILLGLILLVFSAAFIGRGAGVAASYAQGDAALIDLLVSFSDIIICAAWIAAGAGFIRRTAFGESNIISSYIHASLLFLSLIALLLLKPLVWDAPVDAGVLITITVMGVFFFIPSAVFLGSKN